ncbi:hypothetical protein Droror1_Dr00016657 [Drosera rotundifolia]
MSQPGFPIVGVFHKMSQWARKRQRNGNPIDSATSSTVAVIVDPRPPESALKFRPPPPAPAAASSTATASIPPPIPGGFNDSASADVILRLYIDNSPFDSGSENAAVPSNQSAEVLVHVHSEKLLRAKYFDALLSDRWNGEGDSYPAAAEKPMRLNLGVGTSVGSMRTHLMAVRLLYADDFSGTINCPMVAILLLPVALKLLFEDCIKHCVRFLEAVPWSEEEEQRVLSLIPLLGKNEADMLLARVSPRKLDSCEDMLHGLIMTAIHNHPNIAAVKPFVSRLMRDFSSTDSARRVLEKAFLKCLKDVKQALEEYSSPDLRGNQNETEAIQRLNLHGCLSNGKQLVWLVERMVELRVAELAVNEWSKQSQLALDLHRAFREDAWRNIVPGLPSVILKCTSKLADAVVSGTVLADAQVRKKLVEDWLPVLIVCKDSLLPNHKTQQMPSSKSVYVELEEAFLKIISTLPMADSQELLRQCLSFSTRDYEDCPHLIAGFNTWFHRATRPPQTS